MIRRTFACALLAAIGFSLNVPGAVEAQGFLFYWKRDCPRPSYSRMNYWAPEYRRVMAQIRGYGISQHADDCYDGLPAPQNVIFYHCPSVDPMGMYLDTNRPYDPNGPYSSAPVGVPVGVVPE